MQDIVSIIKKGGIGVIATDTLYGVVGSAFLPEAVERIYDVKGRDENKPFIVLVSSIVDLKKFGIKLTEKHRVFLKNVWPGKVSVILPCTSKKFEYLHRGTKSLAFRMPDKKDLIELLKKTGPLVAPSANPQGMPPATTATGAKNYFKKSVDFYVSEGRKEGEPSVIISLVKKEPEIIRGSLLKLKK